MALKTKLNNNMEYGYCKDCKCWHSKFDKCSDVQADKARKNDDNSRA